MQMLDAVINLKDNFSETLNTIDNNARDFQRTMHNTGRDVWRAGKGIENTGKTMTKGLTVPLLGMAAGAVKVGMEFESSMSEVAATMGITVEEIENGSESFELLENAAREMGKTTQYSASESAEALNYLALAGYDAEQSAEMLPKVLNLAAAGGLELAYASDLVTDSMEALGLSTGQADGFIDQMAKTAQKSNTDVAQLGEAILVVGANGRELAGGTQELSTAIGLLGNAGIKGSEAGTKLRNIIMAMTPTTKSAITAFKSLGVESYDAQGNLRPLNDTMLDLSKSMEGMSSKEKTELMSQIFNKQDLAAASTLLASVTQSTGDLDYALEQMGISTRDLGINLDDMIPIMEGMGSEQEAVNYIMDQFGATTEEAQAIYEGLMGVMGDESAWEELEGHIEDSEGTAKEMADTLMHNLKGAFTRVKSALEGFGETVYNVLKPSLEDGTGFVQKFIDKLNSLSPEQVEKMVEVAKKVALMGPALVIIGKLVKGIGKVGLKISDFAGAINKAGGVMKLLTSPAAIAIGVVLALAAAANLVYKNWDKIKPVIDKVRDAFNEFVENNQDKIDWVKEKFGELATTIKEKMSEAWDVFQTAKEKVSEFAEYISGPVETAKEIFISLSETIWEKIQGLAELFEPLKESFSELFSSLGDTFGLFKEYFSDLFAELGALFDLVIPYLLPIMAFIGGVFVGSLIVQFMTLLNMVVVAIEGIAGVLDGLIQIMTGVIEFVVGVFTGDWDRAWNGVKTIFDGVVQLITSIWQTFVGFVTAPVDAVVDILDATFHEKVEGVKKAWESVKTFLKNPIKGTVNLAKKGWNALTGVGNNYKGTDNWEGGPTWVHEKGPEIIDLPSGTRIYPHAKSLEMAKQQGADSVRRNAEQVRTIIQPIARTASSHAPGITDIGQWIKQRVAPANNIQQPVEKPMKPKIMPINSEVPSRVEKPEKKERRSILIEKLAETIVVREDADIDKITKAIVKELEKVELNMA